MAGYAAAILDNACGYVVQSKMAPGQTFTTLELKVAYHKAMTRETGPVRAEAKILSIGRRAAFVEARLTDICRQTLCICNIEPDRHLALSALRNP